MNRPPTIYLGGPINGCTDDEALNWREWLMTQLPTCAFLDPMRRDYRGREDECADEIVRGDMADIDLSDITVFNCWQTSWGTAQEILYSYRYAKGYDTEMASRPGKRVVLVLPEDRAISPWLRRHSDHILPTLEAAVPVLEALVTEFMGRYYGFERLRV